MTSTLGARLKIARKQAQLSQIEAAKLMNVSRQSFSKWENDYNYPDLDNLVNLSELYQVSLDDLLKGGADGSESIS